MAFRYCNHIKTNGTQCHSPAKRGKFYCHYHLLYRRRIKPVKGTPGTMHIPTVDCAGNFVNVDTNEPYAQRYKFGSLEDAPALQVALSTVINALADNRLDIGRASTLLYAFSLPRPTSAMCNSNYRHRLHRRRRTLRLVPRPVRDSS